MKKVIGINASPRKNGNTATMIRSALEGAKAAGAETEFVQLSELTFTGCKSCFGCKLLDSPKFGKCGLKDDLSEVLEKVLAADAVVIGSPVYFGDTSSFFRAFLERILFPNCTYSEKLVYPKRVKVGLVFTMNIKDAYGEYSVNIPKYEMMFNRFLGDTCTVVHTNSCQFDDYSKYSSAMFDPVEKANSKKVQLPKDCEKAFEMGKTLVN